MIISIIKICTAVTMNGIILEEFLDKLLGPKNPVNVILKYQGFCISIIIM